MKKSQPDGCGPHMISQIAAMKNVLLIALILCCRFSFSQTLIHAHNDYEKPSPLFTALENKVFNVEADVYLENGVLLVAHEKKDLKPERTLKALYIDPIVKLFATHKGTISADKSYKVNLVVDIKEKGDQVIQELVKLLEPYRKYFDRKQNPNAVQLVLSGDRTPVQKWTSYPSFIAFDGRPYEVYDKKTLQRVAFISDSYGKYINRQDLSNMDSVTNTVARVHALKKPIRFWGAPDNEEMWNKLIKLHVDIINTDKVADCRKFLDRK
jgi:glycerophosphoryl diester phosphodiesterase